ncbi:MAG: secretin N-terminal domain-containing protein [Gammaproteobacteria bacterium]
MKRLTLLLFAALLGIAGTAFADYPIEVIELKSRSYEEILPLVQPFVGSDGTVTGIGSSLIIKAAPERVNEIKRLLATLDRPPKRLRILVDNGDNRARSSSGYRASADIKTGNGQISINSPGYPVDSSRAEVRLHDRQSSTTQSSQQFVQAMEGQPAYISSGLQVPLRTTERYYGGGIPYQRTTTQLHDVTRGFYVVPRVSGDTVTLEIAQHNDQPGRRYGVVDTQRIESVVHGRLGEWIDLGGLDTTETAHQGGLGRSVNSQQGRLQGIQVKVECLNCDDDR